MSGLWQRRATPAQRPSVRRRCTPLVRGEGRFDGFGFARAHAGDCGPFAGTFCQHA